jgi:hypothetical protein
MRWVNGGGSSELGLRCCIRMFPTEGKIELYRAKSGSATVSPKGLTCVSMLRERRMGEQAPVSPSFGTRQFLLDITLRQTVGIAIIATSQLRLR